MVGCACETLSMAAEEYVSLCLLGPLQLSPWPEDAPELVRKSRGLLGYLGGVTTPQARHTLAELFFHQAKDPSAALRWHLTRLRKVVGAQHLSTPSGFVSLIDVHRDVDIFASAARELIQCADDAPDPSVVSHQIDLIQQHYRGAFLEGLEVLDCPDFVLWLLGKRAYFARLYADSLRAGISALRRLSMLMEALPLARASISHHPKRATN